MTPSPSSITTNDLDDLLSFVVEYQAITLAQIFTSIGKADTNPQSFPKPITFTHYTVESLLILAIHLADALHTVHQQYPVHGNLNPTAIFIEATQPQTPHTIQIHILDPDAAIKSGLGQQLSYIAPEQTGRLEHTSDHRADLYSLGVIFYQLLTGQLPFTISDPLALVYAHIAINPSPPIEVNPILPLPLSNIVLKLLAKDPWDRYQSAATLRADLKKCLVCWQSFGQIETFSLGQSDFVDRLVLPEKLYGRGYEQSRHLYSRGNFQQTCLTSCAAMSFSKPTY